MSTADPSQENELVITRIFDAPRELVFRAWTEPERFMKWTGPRGFVGSNHTIDLRPGGAWRVMIKKESNGEELWHGGVYREVAPPERLVFTFAWDGDDGKPENEMLIELNLEEHEGKTKMTFRQTRFKSIAQRDGHRGGWNSSFDKLDELIATTRDKSSAR